MERVEIRFTGTSPLLMHRCVLSPNDRLPKPKKDEPIQVTAERAAYRLPGGELYFLAAAFHSSLLKGAVGMKIGKTAATSVLKGSIFYLEDFQNCILQHPRTGEALKQYEIAEHVANNQQKGRILVYRPLIREWEICVPFEYDEDLLSINAVIEVFNEKAGRKIGVGAFRPENRGIYGRYTAQIC